MQVAWVQQEVGQNMSAKQEAASTLREGQALCKAQAAAQARSEKALEASRRKKREADQEVRAAEASLKVLKQQLEHRKQQQSTLEGQLMEVEAEKERIDMTLESIRGSSKGQQAKRCVGKSMLQRSAGCSCAITGLVLNEVSH